MPGILFQLSPCSPRGQSMAVLLVFACLLVFSSAIPVGEDDLRTELRAIAQRMTAQEAELKSSNAEVQALRTQVEDAQSEIVSLRSLVTARAATFEAKITARDKRIAQLEEIAKLHASLKHSRAPGGSLVQPKSNIKTISTSTQLDTCPSDCASHINRVKTDVQHNFNSIATLGYWISGNMTAANNGIAKNAAAIAKIDSLNPGNQNLRDIYNNFNKAIGSNYNTIKANAKSIAANSAAVTAARNDFAAQLKANGPGLKDMKVIHTTNNEYVACPGGYKLLSCGFTGGDGDHHVCTLYPQTTTQCRCGTQQMRSPWKNAHDCFALCARF